MSARFTSDPNKGPGFGIITIDDVSCSSEPSFALYRASDGQCLSAHGWTTAENYIQPDAWDNDSGPVRLMVGPQVTNNLDDLETFRILIKEKGVASPPQSCVFIIESIAYTNWEGGQSIEPAVQKDTQAPKKAVRDQEAKASAAPAKPPKELLLPPPVAAPLPPPVAPITMAEESTELVQKYVPEPPRDASQGKKKTTLWIVLVLLVLLAAGGAALWWFYLKDVMLEDAQSTTTEQQPETEPETEAEATSEEEKEAEQAQEKPAPETQPEAHTAPVAPQQVTPPQAAPNIMAQTYDLLSKNESGEASLALVQDIEKNAATTAGTAEEQTKALDAIFLLTEDAAQKNIPSAMHKLGTFYDPSSTVPKGSIESDAEQAYIWYSKAKAAGYAESAQALQSLRAWVEKEAAAGNASARMLLNRNW